jgi:hypothetical protein
MEYHGTKYKRSVTCCKDCPDRYPGCHDHCETFIKESQEWRDRKDFIKKAKRKEKQFDDFRIESFAKHKRG